MLHACFVCISICFVCTLIQYLAFSGTNLLTRCHSASSCFLLFLYFRKVVQKIFPELHGEKLPVPYNHVTKTVPEDDLRGASQGGVWAHLGAPDSASSPIYSPFWENPRGMRKILRKVP